MAARKKHHRAPAKEPAGLVAFAEIARKFWLDGRVAAILGVELREVAVITEAFLHEAMKALVARGAIRLDGLGVLRVLEREGAVPFEEGSGTGRMKKKFVSFRKSVALTKALKEARHGEVRSERGSVGTAREVRSAGLSKVRKKGRKARKHLGVPRTRI